MTAKTTLLAAAFAAVCAGAAAPAGANVIYSFQPATITVLQPDRTPAGYTTPRFGAGFSFELSDAAIERGSFTFTGVTGYGPASFRGDVDDFVSFVGPEARVTAASLGYATLDLSLTFDGFGNVLTGSLSHTSWDERLTFTIADNFVSGRWDSEFPSCWHGCAETGALMIRNVPEPASLALVGFGLVGLLAARRRA